MNCAFFNKSMGYCSKHDQDTRPQGGCKYHKTQYEADYEAYQREFEDDYETIND